jgi:crossover junction endodeoxyribonuclease RuvC
LASKSTSRVLARLGKDQAQPKLASRLVGSAQVARSSMDRAQPKLAPRLVGSAQVARSSMDQAQPKLASRLVGSAQVVLGLDPGLARMGYGAVRLEGNRMKAVLYGTLETSSKEEEPDRLAKLYDGLRDVFRKVRPDVAAIEELFFSKNVKTAMGVAQARGVALLVCGQEKVPVFSLKPGQVKQAVTGYGSAEKGQVQRMVKLLLGLSEIPKPDDTADALAVAIAQAQCNPAFGHQEEKRHEMQELPRKNHRDLPLLPGMRLSGGREVLGDPRGFPPRHGRQGSPRTG